MENKLTHNGTKTALSKRREPLSTAIKTWIAGEIASLSILWDRPLSPERLKGYAETLAEFQEYKLRISFRWMRGNWKARDFGFPLPADFIEHMTEVTEHPRIEEWKGPTEKEKQEREAAIQSGELAEFWRNIKAIVTAKGMT